MRRRIRHLGALVSTFLLVAACAPSEEARTATRAAIETAVRAYAVALAEAYREGDAERLTGVATRREVDGLARRLADLGQEGRRLEPALLDLAFEEVDPYDATNATVATVERWHLRVVHAGSGTVLSEAPGQVNRVAYHLVRDRGRWLVLFRQIQQGVD